MLDAPQAATATLPPSLPPSSRPFQRRYPVSHCRLLQRVCLCPARGWNSNLVPNGVREESFQGCDGRLNERLQLCVWLWVMCVSLKGVGVGGREVGLLYLKGHLNTLLCPVIFT